MKQQLEQEHISYQQTTAGCITTAPVVVTVNTTPTLTVQDTTTCSPNTIDLTDATYWSTDLGAITYFESDGITVVGDPTAVGAGTYILSANNLGCIAAANVTVTVNALPVIAAVHRIQLCVMLQMEILK